jgi:demethylspheroidene O-methyltransferase
MRTIVNKITLSVLARPGLRRAALKFWPSRLIAQRDAQTLFDLISGFVYSQVLYSVSELGILNQLKKKARTLTNCARHPGSIDSR